MALYTEIQKLIIEFTGESLSLDEFAEQFASIYEAARRSDQATSDMSAKVQQLYDDLLLKEIDEAEFSRQLKPFASPQVTQTNIRQSTVFIFGEASNSPTPMAFPATSTGADPYREPERLALKLRGA